MSLKPDSSAAPRSSAPKDRKPALWAAMLALLLVGGCSSRDMAQSAAPDTAPPTALPAPGALPPPPRPAGPPAPAAPPVYNIGLSPRSVSATGAPLLQAGVRTVLSLDIGPRKTHSVIGPQSPPEWVLKSTSDMPLTAILFCSFCEPTDDAVHQQFIFRPSEGRSEEVRFTIVPKKLPDDASYDGALQLTLIDDGTGKPFDRINVGVSVEGAVNPARSSVDDTLAITPADVDDNPWEPDVVLFAMASKGQVTLELEPVSAPMKERLGPLALDAKGKRKVFRTGATASQIEAMTNSAYGAMSALSMQGVFLERLSAEGRDAAVSKDSQKTLELTPDESSRVTKVIADAGMSLYRDLIAWNADLDHLIQRLEEAGGQSIAATGRPLRVRVQTNRMSLPWQYLHPIGVAVDPDRFWGLRFSLSVERVSDGASVPSNFRVNSKAHKISFARYTPSSDESVPYAMKQIDQLRRLPIPDSDLIEVSSGEEFEQAMQGQRKELSAIFTFLHASSGDVASEPSLQFDNGDRVSVSTLDSLLNQLSGDELRAGPYLAGGPLVVLNACETGPARQLPYVKFQDVLAHMGARGVVTTEVSVWITLGHEVGTRLIERLGKKEPIAEALTAIRRELYAEKKNPLGLLYAYYGNPAATLQK